MPELGAPLGWEEWDPLAYEPEGAYLPLNGRLSGWYWVRGRARSFLCHPGDPLTGRRASCGCGSFPHAQAITPCSHLRALQDALAALPPPVPCPACKAHPVPCMPCQGARWVSPEEAEGIRVWWPEWQATKARFQEELAREQREDDGAEEQRRAA